MRSPCRWRRPPERLATVNSVKRFLRRAWPYARRYWFDALIVVGIGINLSSEIVPLVQTEATSVESETGRKPDGDVILNELLNSIAERYDLLHSAAGCEHIIREWCEHSSFAMGRRVRVTLSDEAFEGTTRGLESDGALRVETAGGKMKVVRAGDVTAVRSTNG